MKTVLVLAVLLGGAFAAPKVLNKNIKITNGEDAQRNQFPYQVTFEYAVTDIWVFFCGGSIITENWVLTAGHCITQSPEGSAYRIRAGLLNLDDDLETVQTIEVSSYVVHEDYPGSLSSYDIAVLRLATPLTFTEAVQPIALPEAGVVPTGDAILSGWGSTSTEWVLDMPNTLQTVTIPIISLEECADALIYVLESSEPLHTTNICTGPLFSGISGCSGDSGGPLAQDGQLIGITSWAIIPCGWPGAPTVYTQVSSYIDWINEHID